MPRGLILLSLPVLVAAVCAPGVAQNAATANDAPAQTAATQAPSSPVTLHVETNLVQIPVLVLKPRGERLGTPVAADRFSISLNGGPAFRPKFARPEGDDPIDLAIVIDASAPQADLMGKMDETIAGLAPAYLHAHDTVSIYVIDCSSLHLVENVPAEPAQLKSAADQAMSSWKERKRSGDKSACKANTHLFDDLAVAVSKLYEQPGRRVLLAVTDGTDRESKMTLAGLADLAQIDAVAMFGMSHGTDTGEQEETLTPQLPPQQRGTLGYPASSSPSPVNTGAGKASMLTPQPADLLASASESTGGMMLTLDGSSSLPKEMQRLVTMLRERYIVEFPRPDHLQAGKVTMTIKVDGLNAFVRWTGDGVPPAEASPGNGFGTTPGAPPTQEQAAAPATENPKAGTSISQSAPPAAVTNQSSPQPVAPQSPPLAAASGAREPAPPDNSSFTLQAPAVAQNAPAINPGPMPTALAPGFPSSVPTLKTSSQLVVVDVVVTGSDRRPVHGLKASDFTISENNTPQVIRNFEEHTALTQADATKFAPMPKLPPGVFTNYTPTPVSGAVNILLLDKLNTPMQDQIFVRQQLLAYLKSTPPGTRIAIFGLTTRLILLQGFTSDPEVLRTIMEKGLSDASPALDDQVGGGGVQESPTDHIEEKAALDDNFSMVSDALGNMRQFDAIQQSLQLDLRVQYTLDAMNQIAHYVSSIPGRKNLIWFSGSFPIDVLPDSNAPGTPGAFTNPFIAVTSSKDEYRDTVDMLSRSQVAVYPVAAQGLINSPVLDATTNRKYVSNRGGIGQARMNQDEFKFTTDTGAAQLTMMDMADATGGQAFVNTNDLTKATAMAIDDGSNFYTLSYMPANYKPDGKLHKIKVQVAHRGVNLSYRRGYYADNPSKPNSGGIKDGAVVSTDGQNSADTLRLAMMRGTPPPSDILMTAGVVPINLANQPEDAPAPGDQLAAKTHGPYRRYSVNYAINPHDILFYRGDDGKIHSDFQLIIYVLTPDGELVNLHSSTVRVAATLEQLGKDFANGIFRHEEVSAPIKGEYFLRIAVHDLHRDHYGAVEVATSQVNRLVPAQPGATPASTTTTPAPVSAPAPAPASK